MDSFLGEHFSRKPISKGSVLGLPPFPRSSSNDSNATDEGLFEQPEPFVGASSVLEKLLKRKSMQLRDRQHDWQVLFHIHIENFLSFDKYCKMELLCLPSSCITMMSWRFMLCSFLYNHELEANVFIVEFYFQFSTTLLYIIIRCMTCNMYFVSYLKLRSCLL